MDIRKLQRAIVDGLEDVKAQNIAVLNTEHLSALFERVIIASGTSNRQTKALAASVREWIIVDCGAAVVHIMQPGIRDYYHLEEIWGGKPVRMKVGEVKTRLVKASEPEPVRKAAARAAAKTAGQPAARPAAKRPATRKSPAKPAGASRPAAGQTPAAKAAPARKTTPRKAAAGTTTARKTTTRKTSRAG